MRRTGYLGASISDFMRGCTTTRKLVKYPLTSFFLILLEKIILSIKRNRFTVNSIVFNTVFTNL